MSLPPFVENKRGLGVRPTRFGGLFILLLAPVLAAALNFNNNSACLLVFLLVSLFFVSFVKGGINLFPLQLTRLELPDTFAGNRAVLSGAVTSKRRFKFVRPACAVTINGKTSRGQVRDTGTGPDFKLALPLLPRGVHRISRVLLSCSYPMGFFDWTLSLTIHDCAAWVYPEPKDYVKDGSGDDRFPPGDDDGDFDQLIQWQQGDPLSGLCWKTLARTGRQMKKTFYSTRAPLGTVFDWQDLGSLKTEQKLSQLCFLVVRAHERGEPFGLNLPGRRIEAGTGARHYRHCLMSLAAFDPGGSHAV